MSLLIVGNWKMHDLGHKLVVIRSVARCTRSFAGVNEILICVPATLISRAAEASAGIVDIGGENCAAAVDGAFTEDISAEMLKDAGSSSVIVGHSERRQNHQEANTMVAAKAPAAVRAGLAAIVCFSESKADHDAGSALQIWGAQPDARLPLDWRPLAGSAIAYEPLWAIGTGSLPATDKIVEILRFIRQRLRALLGDDANRVRVHYGRSVAPDSARAILELPEAERVLVGGASLKALAFNAIIRAAASITAKRLRQAPPTLPEKTGSK